MLLVAGPTTMLLGPVPPTTVLRKLAMLLGTTVVLASRFRVHHLRTGLIKPPGSSPGSIRAHGRRTIARRSHRRHDPKTTVRRKLHRHDRKIIARLRLRRQDPSSRPVRQTRGSNRRRHRIGPRPRRGLKTSSATTRLRKRAPHSHLRNVRAVPRPRHHSETRVRRLRHSGRVAQLLRSGTTIRRETKSLLRTTKSLLRTKISSRQTVAEQHFPNYRPAFSGWPFSFSRNLPHVIQPEFCRQVN
jgi:hypothetical protein